MGIIFHKRSRRDIPFTIRMDEETLEKVREISYKEDLSLNETINQGLEYVVEEYWKERSGNVDENVK